MKTLYQIKDGHLIADGAESPDVVVYAMPDADEKRELIEALEHDAHDLESALDPDEVSRLDMTPGELSIIWKRPNNVSFKEHLKFEVSSVGLFLKNNHLTVILGDPSPAFIGKEFQRVRSINDLLLRFFQYTVHHYLGHLKGIKMLTSELQDKLQHSMENHYLIQMFVLSESLVYYLNAIEANTAVLLKLRACASKIGFTEEDIEKLDDIIIDHQQCDRQIQIYSSVMSGLMDARAAVINNNMNVLLKNLTLINVVFMPLNLLAGILGMSEFSRFTESMDWRISYSLFVLVMGIFGWVTWVILVRVNSPEAVVRPRKK